MLSYTTWLVSKMDPAKYIFEKLALTRWIARWQVLLSEFDIIYVTQKAIKGSALVSYLSQQPLNDYQPMHPEFPDEDIMALFGVKVEDEDKDKWIVWFDGASNALGHGVRAALLSPDNNAFPSRPDWVSIARIIWLNTRHAPLESKRQLTLTSSCSKCIETQPW